MKGRLFRSAVVALTLGAASGCASVTTAGGDELRIGSDRFSAYAEQVFREQNRVAGRLAFALDAEEEGSPRYRALADAEDALLEACTGLNEIAARRRDGRRAGALRGLRAARAAPDCERAAAAAAGVLGPPEAGAAGAEAGGPDAEIGGARAADVDAGSDEPGRRR
ncbi:MAG TPA: hypothetical protein VFV10_19645 [Gammaproteobacteria bacterium]|nr:hypothetical protein [Gammaproteobacteria bacterium]